MLTKVIHIINSLPKIGGAERLLLDAAYSRAPSQTKVITWKSADVGLSELDIKDCMDVLALRPFSVSKLIIAYRWIKEAELLHVHLFPSLYLFSLLPIPKIFTEHNTTNRRRSYGYLRPLERFVYKRYNHVVSISESTQNSLRDWIDRCDTTFSVIENGIDLSRFNSVIRRLDKEIVTLGMAGTFSEQKNQDLLIRALEILPMNVCIALAGIGPRKQELVVLAEKLGVRSRVSFLGNVTNMTEFYDSIDIYIQSSHWEGFGLTIVEAMASGLPCLASKIPGMSDVVGNRKMLFHADSVDELAVSVKSLIDSKSTYDEYSRYSVARAKEYSIERMVESYDELYKSILLDCEE